MLLADVFRVDLLELLCSSHHVGVAFMRGPTSFVNLVCTLICEFALYLDILGLWEIRY